jgi:hypothetical protein
LAAQPCPIAPGRSGEDDAPLGGSPRMLLRLASSSTPRQLVRAA